MPSTFINRDKVVKKLIKERCKLAARKSEKEQKEELIAKKSLHEETDSKGEKTKIEKNIDICKFFPRRKDWCHLGKERVKLDSIKRNEQSLWFTYLRAKHHNTKDEWYVSLCEYADYVVRLANDANMYINPPHVMVLEKKNDDKNKCVECRAVCIFPETLKIIFSLLNKYLTGLFDSYFKDCSYAFRQPKKDGYPMQHLKAVSAIQTYRMQHIGMPLYVAECDMQKFYDTINHHTIKTRFSFLMQRAIRDDKISRDEAKLIKKWFFKYVDCYSFYQHVYIHNKKEPNHPFWRKIKSRKEGQICCIKWIETNTYKYLKRKYLKRENGYIGVPQGGALSGLIANIMMHDVDIAVLGVIQKKDAIYCRFCDDMILIGNDRAVVKDAFEAYKLAVKQSRLFAHSSNADNLRDFEKGKTTQPYEKMKDFWKGKTREPYEWSEKGINAFPWITFVGFDINWMGDLRMRNASFKKHIKKQNMVASEILLPYLNGKEPRYSKVSIKNTIYRKLIAMSVGRISLRNYNANENIHSWMSAYSILDKNPWAEEQLKNLDRHRQVVLARASKILDCNNCIHVRKSFNARELQLERFTFKGCPFSYYGQCFIYKKK